MKTAKEIVQMIDYRSAGEDHYYFEIEIEEGSTFTQILGEVSRRYIDDVGGEWYGCKEIIPRCTDAEIIISEINSYNGYGEPIPTAYDADEIEREAFRLTY